MQRRTSLNRIKLIFFGLCALLVPVVAFAAPPAGYPADYQKIIDAGKKEGKLVIYTTTDIKNGGPLVKDFESMYGIKVEYNDKNSTELYSAFISEAAAGGGTADILWNSAMDLAVKLANDGYAMQYKSPEASKIPAWANMEDKSWGSTYEPVAIVYNKRLLQQSEVPKSHAELTKFLGSNPKLKGKLVTYDPERSGIGFMFLTNDMKHDKNFWDMCRAMGNAGVKVFTSTGAMMEKISSGEALLGYNLVGSYAVMKAKKDPSIGYLYPSDHSLVLSRVLTIPKAAKNPNAAKLFVDYMLSVRGQKIIAGEADLFSIRADVTGEYTAAGLSKQLGKGAKVIAIDKNTAEYLDQKKRLDFLDKWQQAMGTKK
jgi:iron(III) transport system substrate-binding protein